MAPSGGSETERRWRYWLRSADGTKGVANCWSVTKYGDDGVDMKSVWWSFDVKLGVMGELSL